MVFRKAVPWGPLNFSIYEHFAISYIQYTDDTTLICSGSNPASAAISIKYLFIFA